MGRIARTANSTSRKGFVKIAIAEVGAAYLAGLTCGLWSDVSDIRRSANCGRVFEPDMQDEKRSALLAGWRNAVRKSRL